MNNEPPSVSCGDCGKEYAHFSKDEATEKAADHANKYGENLRQKRLEEKLLETDSQYLKSPPTQEDD